MDSVSLTEINQGGCTCIWSMESMMMIIFPWWRADSLSSQRGNSSRILLGSMERPEMDQKCCSSYARQSHNICIQLKVLHPCTRDMEGKLMGGGLLLWLWGAWWWGQAQSWWRKADQQNDKGTTCWGTASVAAQSYREVKGLTSSEEMKRYKVQWDFQYDT